jgi:hypothetical protein
MIKRIFSALVFTAIMASCGNKGPKEVSTTEGQSSDGTSKVEFAALIANPGDYVGKPISVEGKVVHVCTHSGKKLFITGENPDIRLFIQAGEEMPKFPMDLLGSEIVVEGTLTSAATAATPAASADMHSVEGHQMASADTCETSKAMAAQPVLADLVMVYSKHSILK